MEDVLVWKKRREKVSRTEEEKGGAHLVHTPLPRPYDPAGHWPHVPSDSSPVPPPPPAQHSPLAQDAVQAVDLVTVCVAMAHLKRYTCVRESGQETQRASSML